MSKAGKKATGKGGTGKGNVVRRGVATIVGEPNAGKSTLLNALVGQKVAIVTHKPQTTRNRLLGIAEIPARKPEPGKKARPAAQVVLMDTPGILSAQSLLDRRMLREIHEALEGRDVVLLVVDAHAKPPWEKAEPGNRQQTLLELLKKLDGPVFLLLNKIDLVEKSELLPLIAAWTERYKFAEVLPIAARRAQGLEELKDAVVAVLPQGERFFPEDQVTDLPERFLVAELIRERILVETGQEIPYAAAVVVERFEEATREEARRAEKQGKAPVTRIAAAIYCEREGQKAILIGKQGAMLKKIGTSARKEIEELLDTRVMLELFVKVEKDWRDSAAFLEGTDWRKQIEGLGLKQEPLESKE